MENLNSPGKRHSTDFKAEMTNMLELNGIDIKKQLLQNIPINKVNLLE